MKHLKTAAYSLDEHPFEENISKYLKDSKSCEIPPVPINPGKDPDEIINRGMDLLKKYGDPFAGGNFDF